MNIVGIDASPHSTGLVKFILNDNLEILEIKKLGFLSIKETKRKKEEPNYKDIINYPESLDFFNRTLFMHNYIFPFISGCDYACVEDYNIFGAGMVFQLAEFCSTLKFFLLNQGTKLRLIPPLSLKMYATNDGRSGKPEMLESFLKDPILKYLDLSYLPQIKTHKSGKYVGLKNKNGEPGISDIVDASWLVRLLHEELQIRKGSKSFSDLLPKHSEVLSKKTKANPIPIFQKPFIERL